QVVATLSVRPLQVHVESRVTVDEVVPTAALDHVAARTTQDDVVGLVGRQERRGVPGHLPTAQQLAEVRDLIEVPLCELVPGPAGEGLVPGVALAPEHVR